MERICLSPDTIEYGRRENGLSSIPPISLKDTGRTLIRFPLSEFTVDTTREVSCRRGNYTYTLSLPELGDLLNNRPLYNSPALFAWEWGPEGKALTDNRMFFMNKGKAHFIAETTAAGFQIGETKLKEPILMQNFEFIQAPEKMGKLYDVAHRDSVDFLYIKVDKAD